MTEIDDRGFPQMLPKYSGGDCDNPECDAAHRHVRVLSREEFERAYMSKKQLPAWPLPPQATHACEKCGFLYQGVSGQSSFNRQSDDTTRTAVSREEWSFSDDDLYSSTVRDAIEAVIRGRPSNAGLDEIEEAVERWVPGASRTDAKMVTNDLDIDITVYNAADFM